MDRHKLKQGKYRFHNLFFATLFGYFSMNAQTLVHIILDPDSYSNVQLGYFNVHLSLYIFINN